MFSVFYNGSDESIESLSELLKIFKVDEITIEISSSRI